MSLTITGNSYSLAQVNWLNRQRLEATVVFKSESNVVWQTVKHVWGYIAHYSQLWTLNMCTNYTSKLTTRINKDIAAAKQSLDTPATIPTAVPPVTHPKAATHFTLPRTITHPMLLLKDAPEALSRTAEHLPLPRALTLPGVLSLSGNVKHQMLLLKDAPEATAHAKDAAPQDSSFSPSETIFKCNTG
jgi:hypothetical protein